MNRVIVITGGTSGIGLELVKHFEENKDTVITLSTRKSENKNHYSVDVSNEKEVNKVIDEIGKKYKKIDMLINNAGGGMSGITELLPTENIHKLTEINYYGTLYCTRASIKYMQKGSRIVNVSSAMALFPVPYRAIYASVKSAVLTFSFALRMELQQLGIDVVAICPGNIKTNFTQNRIKDMATNERYGDRQQLATLKNDATEDKRMSAEKCGNIMYKQINKKRTKPFYIIGGKFKLLYFLTCITPKSLLLKITNKFLG